MTLGNLITQYRKNQNITQEALAQKLGVTNQAVSKWESGLCCPDVMLLPKIADIFGISMDTLFGRESQPGTETFGYEKTSGIPSQNQTAPTPTWPDDDVLRVVAYIGHRVVTNQEACEELVFRYEGPALNVDSRVSISCGDVAGDVDAGGNVNCGNVSGSVDAGTNVNCGNVNGDVDAGCGVNCGNIDGSVDAGTEVCCGNVGGSVDAGTDVKCGDVHGDVDAGCSVECSSVEGDIDAGGSVTIRK